MSPKSSAMKTGDLAARMDLCAATDSPATRNLMPEPDPFSLRSSSPKCWCRSEDGTLSEAAFAGAAATSFGSSRTASVHCTNLQSSVKRRSS
jgi:hypothetical protein